MKKKLLIAFSALFVIAIILCGCSAPSRSSSRRRNHSKSSESESNVADIIGDWYGTTEVHSEYNDGTFTALLSINSDGKWASCVNGRVNTGTWEATSEWGNRINLTVEYEGVDITNTWTFEKQADGKYYYYYVYHESIPIEVSKMESESSEELLGDWQGKTSYIYEDGDSKEFTASLSITSDNSWSSSVNGSTNSGHLNYISEAGHLIVLTVEYDNIDSTNTWAFIKDEDGDHYYEYVRYEHIHIPVEKLSP